MTFITNSVEIDKNGYTNIETMRPCVKQFSRKARVTCLKEKIIEKVKSEGSFRLNGALENP